MPPGCSQRERSAGTWQCGGASGNDTASLTLSATSPASEASLLAHRPGRSLGDPSQAPRFSVKRPPGPRAGSGPRAPDVAGSRGPPHSPGPDSQAASPATPNGGRRGGLPRTPVRPAPPCALVSPAPPCLPVSPAPRTPVCSGAGALRSPRTRLSSPAREASGQRRGCAAALHIPADSLSSPPHCLCNRC